MSRWRSARARGVLLWGLAGILLVQLGLRLAIESGLRGCRDPFYEDMMARLRPRWRARVAGGPGTPQRLLVALGSSRTGNGVRGERVEAELAAALGERWAVNGLSAPGSGALMELVNCRRLFAEGVRPDLLLVEVVPTLLAGAPPEAESLKAERFARSEIEMLRECGLPEAAALRRGWWRDWACPWYAHRIAIVSEVVPNFLPMRLQQNWGAHGDRTGWVAMKPDLNAPPGRARALHEFTRGVYEPGLRDFALAGPQCRALRAILADCRGHGVPAALVLLPESTALRSWFGRESLARLEAFLADLRDGHGVPLIDARAWVGDDGFGDDLHLHSGGADVLSRRLGRELAALLRPGPSAPAVAPPPDEVPISAPIATPAGD